HDTIPLNACPSVTAGLRWAPETPPAIYTPNATARPQPQPMIIQSPAATKISSARPEPYIPTTASPTTPLPKAISTNVPINSESKSPHVLCRQLLTFF